MAEDIERLRQAALRDPTQLVRLADALVAEQRADEAVAACRRGLLARPEDVALRLALGRALSAAGLFEEAQATLLDAVSRQQKGGPAPQPPSRNPTRPGLGKLDSPETPPPQFEDDDTQAETRIRRDTPPPPKRSPLPPPARAAAPPSRPTPSRPRQHMPEPMTPLPAPFVPLESSEWPTSAHLSDEAPSDLAHVAERLRGRSDAFAADEDVAVEPDPMEEAWEARRASAFLWIWVSLVLLGGGITGGMIWRAHERQKALVAMVERADARTLEGTYEGDLAARDAYMTALRAEPRQRKYFAMAALADARLAADDGEDSDAAAWAMMKRAEREQKRRPEIDARADRELRQARALLALARGEPCSDTVPAEDGDIAARCALQKADVQTARQILADAVKAHPSDGARAYLALGSLELGSGDLDAALAAYGKVLAQSDGHPRALVGRALVALERNESPQLAQPPVRLGPTTEAWFHLAAGLSALAHGTEADGNRELDLAKKGIVHDGRLALLYGRARLTEGKIGDAEEAMRVAERLDPNDGDVAVLDAEVALAKGYEDKVALALAARPPTPRSLAVLGRALCLLGRYREAAATLDAALARRPSDAVAVTYRALARAHLGDPKGAARDLAKAAATLSPTVPRYGLGLLAYERHDLLGARRELGKSLEHNSEAFRARTLLGRLLRDLGKPKEALAELDSVVKEAPALMSARAARARLYLDLGRDREARNDAREVLDGGRASAEDKADYAEAVARLGRTDEAERAIKDAQDAGAAAGRIARLRLILQTWRGPKEAALAAKALEKERKGAAAHDARLTLDCADAWRRAGDLKKADDLLRAALFSDPLHANLGLGRIALAGNQAQEAEASYRAALASWSNGAFSVDDQTEARIGLARSILARDPKSKEALELLAAATRDDAASADAHYFYAKTAAAQGDVKAARTHADKAVELDDRYAEAFALDGELWQKEDRDKAKKAYKRYLELSPSGPEAKNVRRALSQLK